MTKSQAGVHFRGSSLSSEEFEKSRTLELEYKNSWVRSACYQTVQERAGKTVVRNEAGFIEVPEDFVLIRIFDETSLGIIDKLGEPYLSKNNEGMGLGIFIAKNLIEKFENWTTEREEDIIENIYSLNKYRTLLLHHLKFLD